MQHVRTLCFLLLLTLGVGHLHAQTAAEALRAADQRFDALTSYSATMGYSLGDHHDIGKVYYQGDKYQFDFPEDQTICDGKLAMNWSKEFAAVNLGPAATTGPQLSAGGVYEMYKFAYQIEWVDTMMSILHMRLTAKDESLYPQELLIGIGRKSGLVEEYTIFLRNKLTIKMQVLDFQLNPVLDPKLFEIDMDFVRRVENGEVAPIEHTH